MGVGDWLAKAWTTIKTPFVAIGGSIREGTKAATKWVKETITEGYKGVKAIAGTVYSEVKAGVIGLKSTVDNITNLPGKLLSSPLLWLGGILAAVLVLPSVLKR